MNDFEERSEAREAWLVAKTTSLLKQSIAVHERKTNGGRFQPLDDETIEAALELYEYNPDPDVVEYPAREFIHYCNSYEFAGLTEVEKRAIFEPILWELFALFRTRPQLFRKHAMYLYSLFPTETIARYHPDVKVMVPHENSSRSTFVLKAQHKDWFLCDDTEIRSVLAIQAGVWTVVYDESADASSHEPVFFIKRYGTLAGLCLKDCYTRDGKFFKRGFWYTPSSDALRKTLGDAIESEQRSVQLNNLQGEWAFMRESDSLQYILSDIETHHANNTEPLHKKNNLDDKAVGLLAEMTQYPRRSHLQRQIKMANEGNANDQPVVRLVENLIQEQRVTQLAADPLTADPHTHLQPEHSTSTEHNSLLAP